MSLKTVPFDGIFKKFYSSFSKSFVLNITPPLGIMGSLSLLEKTIIASLASKKNNKKIFEFGTYLGSTTAIMALNSHNECKIYSIDLPKKNYRKKYKKFSYKEFDKIKLKYNTLVQSQNDACLEEVYENFGTFYIENLKLNIKKKIKLIKNDSFTYDFSKFKKSFDLVFIDGGHNIELVKKDTENAFKIVKKGGVILWHDVSSNIHTDVSKYLKSLNIKINHLKHTFLAYKLV
jgi:predicted O-methyltransferase YrrM